MTMPVNPYRFSIKENLLRVWDACLAFAERESGKFIALPDIMRMADTCDNYATKAILMKLTRAGLLEAVYDVSPIHFRVRSPDEWEQPQRDLVQKFDNARRAFEPPTLPPMPDGAFNRPTWK